MPDRVSLSFWIRNYSAQNMLRHFEELLRVFPFSKLRPGIAGLRIYALEDVEPPLLERAFPAAIDADAILSICREFENDDCAYIVDVWWELFQYDGSDWQLKPARVTLTCFGPAFENDLGDHLRIDAGTEDDFLPDLDVPDSERAARSNVAGLIRLAKEIEASMPVERRQLWSESGESLAERLDEAIS